MKNKEHGITLVALVITIIIMTILVVVTINISTDGGLFGKSKEASFKTKVTQILDSVEIKKGEILSDNPRATKYKIKMSELDNVPEETLNEFDGKLKIKSDAKVYYLGDYFDAKEKQWLEDLGIYEYSGLYARVISAKNQIINNPTQYYGENGIYSANVNDIGRIIQQSINTDTQAFITYKYNSVTTPTDSLSNTQSVTVEDFIGDKYIFYGLSRADLSNINVNESGYQRMHNILCIAKNKNLSDDTLLESDTDINAIITEAKQNGDWILSSNTTLEQYKNYLNVFINVLLTEDDEKVLLSFTDITDLSDCDQLMPKEEFDKQFDYQLVNGKLYITKYKGESKNVTIPSAIYDDYGNTYLTLGLKQGTFGNMYPISVNDMIGDWISDFTSTSVTLADAADYAYTQTCGMFSTTVNPYNKYVDENIDGLSTSLEYKHKYVGIPLLKLYFHYINGRVISDQNMESLIASITNDYCVNVNIEGEYDTYFFIDNEEPPMNLVKPASYDSISIFLATDFTNSDETVIDPDGKDDVNRIAFDVALNTKELTVLIDSFSYTNIKESLQPISSIIDGFEAKILIQQSEWRDLGPSIIWGEPWI